MRKCFCFKQSRDTKLSEISNGGNTKETKKLKGFRGILRALVKCFCGATELEEKVDISSNSKDSDLNLSFHHENKKTWQDYREGWKKIVDEVINQDNNKIMVIGGLKQKEEVNPTSNIENKYTAISKVNKNLKNQNSGKIRKSKTSTTQEDGSDGDRCILYIMWTAIFIMLLCAIVVGSTFFKCY
ncbi:hypothetical protein ACOME3_010831, partial [Neoechinorhynchus agilis]